MLYSHQTQEMFLANIIIIYTYFRPPSQSPIAFDQSIVRLTNYIHDIAKKDDRFSLRSESHGNHKHKGGSPIGKRSTGDFVFKNIYA